MRFFAPEWVFIFFIVTFLRQGDPSGFIGFDAKGSDSFKALLSALILVDEMYRQVPEKTSKKLPKDGTCRRAVQPTLRKDSSRSFYIIK